MNNLPKSQDRIGHKTAFVVSAILLTFCFGACLSITTASALAFTFDVMTEDALDGHEYPWYDADSHSVKPLNIPVGQEPTSKERNAVPTGKLKTKTQTTKTTPTGNAGGGGGAGGAAGSMSGLLLAVVILVVLVALVMTFLYIESNKSEQSVKHRSFTSAKHRAITV